MFAAALKISLVSLRVYGNEVRGVLLTGRWVDGMNGVFQLKLLKSHHDFPAAKHENGVNVNYILTTPAYLRD